MTSAIRVATDVGGTFTDLVYFETDRDRPAIDPHRQGRHHTAGFRTRRARCARQGQGRREPVASFAHGTTVVINALTERKGVKTALITTEGFRDVLEIARGNRPDFFNLIYQKPVPFVPRRLRCEVPGRMNYRGEEMAPLDLPACRRSWWISAREGVEAIAVCLLHAYANPAHELALVAEFARLMAARSRSWHRTRSPANGASTSGPARRCSPPTCSRSPNAIWIGSRAASANGYRGQLYIMQSNCGVDSFAATKAIPITMVKSGPASGVWGAAELGRMIGEPNVFASTSAAQLRNARSSRAGR